MGNPVYRRFRWNRLLGLVALLVSLTSCVSAATGLPEINTGPRELDFGGLKWRIKSSTTPVAPGPNYYSSSPEAVWVDDRGMHLTIGKQGEHWYATEIFTRSRVGYGTYTFTVETDARSYDPAVVAGFFTWDTAPEEFNREIDIEFAAWGAEQGTKFQYVVQPYTSPERIVVFDPKLQGNTTTHRIVWKPDMLEFSSYHGRVDPDSPEARENFMNKWTFEGTPPSEGRVRFRINLWLFQGKEPKKPVEMTLNAFSYVRWKP